jgi:hypothetical protein
MSQRHLRAMSRRDLLRHAGLLGLSSRVVFPVLAGVLNASKLQASTPRPPGVLALIVGEGANMAIAGATTRFQRSGVLVGALTPGLSGLVGVEAHSMVLEGVGYRHLPQGGGRFNRVTDPDHERATLSCLCGDVDGQMSVNQHLKRAGFRVADFASSTAVENNQAKAYSASRGLSGGAITPNTTIADLVSDLTLQAPATPTTETASARKRSTNAAIEHLLGVAERTRPSLDVDGQGQLDQYAELMTRQRQVVSAPSDSACALTGSDGGGTSWDRAIAASDVMLNAMRCGALDFGALVVMPTNGTSPAFPGFRSSDPESYRGTFSGLGAFVSNHVTAPREFVDKVCVQNKGNHFVSHLNNNAPPGPFDASRYWAYADTWQNQAQLVMDFQISSLHQRVFANARTMTTTNGSLGEQLLLMTKYGFDDSDAHTFESPLTILTTDRPQTISWNRAVVPEASALLAGRTRQSHRQSQLLLSILRLFEPAATTFADADGEAYPLTSA